MTNDIISDKKSIELLESTQGPDLNCAAVFNEAACQPDFNKTYQAHLTCAHVT